MRALWSLVVVCLVAATGVRPADARTELGTTSFLGSALPAAHALVTRPAQQVVARRASTTPALQLPPVALTTAFSLRTPPPRAIAQVRLSRDRRFVSLVLTCSARGPPIV